MGRAVLAILPICAALMAMDLVATVIMLLWPYIAIAAVVLIVVLVLSTNKPRRGRRRR